MAGILVFVEQRDGEIRKASLQAISQAKREGGAGGPVTAVLPGSGIAGAAAGLGAWGADKVFVADDPNLALYSAEGYAEVVAKAVEQTQPTAIFFAGTAMGRDLAPRLAARLGVGAIPDVDRPDLDGEAFSAQRPVYSGKAIATVTTGGKTPQVISLRPNVFAAEEAGGAGEVVALDGLSLSIRAVVKELVAAGGGELDVAEADIIVSGGRGIKGPENFALIKSLADALGGAVGASRAAVDAGWIEPLPPGRPDRQGGEPIALHRGRHLGRHPAPRRDELVEDDRRHQQGSGCADLQGRRLRDRRRPVRRDSADGRGDQGSVGRTQSSSSNGGLRPAVFSSRPFPIDARPPRAGPAAPVAYAGSSECEHSSNPP